MRRECKGAQASGRGVTPQRGIREYVALRHTIDCARLRGTSATAYVQCEAEGATTSAVDRSTPCEQHPASHGTGSFHGCGKRSKGSENRRGRIRACAEQPSTCTGSSPLHRWQGMEPADYRQAGSASSPRQTKRGMWIARGSCQHDACLGGSCSGVDLRWRGAIDELAIDEIL